MVAIGFLFAAQLAATQEIVTRPRAPAPTPQDPPLVTPRPDFALRDGIVSAGLAGKLVLARETDLSQSLHSTLSGSMVLDSPGEWNGEGDVGVRKGFLLWSLRDRSGCRGAIGFMGDPSSTMLHASVETPLPAAVTLDAHGQSRWERIPEGGARVGHASLGLRRQLAPFLTVHPRVYIFDVRARDDFRWVGSAMRVEFRGAELSLHHEGERGNRVITRKTWKRRNLRWTLGGHLERHPARADRSLWECAVSRDKLGVAFYPGDTQRGILLRAGAIQLGFGHRPRAQQTVLGFKNVSLSMLAHDDGRREFGFGFVYGDLLRAATQTTAGWQWYAHHRSAIDDPRLRWPGLATLAH